MRKLTLIVAALALVLGISQCKKQEDPMGKLVTQKVTFTTSFGDGSKLNPGEDGGSLNPKWEVGDKIIVSDGVTTPASELECKEIKNEGTEGVFEGTITCQENANLTFSYNPIDYKNQDGSLQIYLEGISGYQESGNYEVNMTMPCAILKLDLAELAPASYVSVKIGDNEVAKVVKNITTEDSKVYLLLPLQASGETTLTFTNGTTMTITKTYNLAPNSFNSAGGNGGYAPVEPATPKFTVDANGTTVEFAPGNLYWSFSAFKFEDNQWSFAKTRNESHMSHFFWSKTASVAYASEYSASGASTSDEFFTNNAEFTVNGERGWRTLSQAEWDYLLNSRTSGLRAWVTLTDVNVSGLVILPDGSSATASGITMSSALADAGAVFLPAAGLYTSSVNYVGTRCYYWSSTSGGSNNKAYYMYFGSGSVNLSEDLRQYGSAVRLVRDVK